ncbi:MAG: LytTR family transcriptional regulator DNA-binding domain-containing protein [Prevotellaceae bacterium]|nr:LytTR family transcriptional regulator DNA-binding domain-containing protein [Prevotellaceae bacterium]
MTKHLVVSNSNLLIRVTSGQVAYITSDGSYSTMVLTDGRQHVFSFNLSTFERLLETQLGTESQIFIRLGKSLIINSSYIYCINVSKQELVLSGFDLREEISLSASREALKALKSVIEESTKSRRIGI